MSAAFEDNAGALIELLNGQTDPTVTSLTVVSGTAQQDATGLASTMYVTIGLHAAGTVEVQIGPSNAVAHTIMAADDATTAVTKSFRLPPNWWFKVTVGGSATIGAATQITG